MLWFLALALQAQDEVRVSSRAYVPQSPNALRVDTKVVEIAAVVRDVHGKAVAGLTKEDFRVLDNGKTRVIDHFSVSAGRSETPETAPDSKSPESLKSGISVAPPRFLALFIDDVNGKDGPGAGDLKRTQTAAEKFVKESLRPDTRVAIFTASGTPNVDFTADEAKLIAAIAALRPHVEMREEGMTPCPRVTPYLAMRIAHDQDPTALRAVLADSRQKNCPVTQGVVVTQAEETWRRVKEISTDTLDFIGRVVDHLGSMPGKRDLVLASSGFLTATLENRENKIIDHALRSGVVISALDSKGLYGEALPGSRPQDASGYSGAFPGAWFKFESTELPARLLSLNEAMANLAEGTGGVFYHNNNDLNAGFKEVGTPPEVAYHLSFRPEEIVQDGSYHKLKITAGKHLVQARPGYFAPIGQPAAEISQARIDQEIMADDTKAEFPVTLAGERSPNGLTVVVHIDLAKLRFSKQGDRQVQKLLFTTALIDGQGKIAAAKESVLNLALTEATYKRLIVVGVNAKVTLHVAPGMYKLRQVSEEGIEGKIACSAFAVEVK